MDVKMNLLGVTFLVVIFLTLLIISRPTKRPAPKFSKERRACPRHKTSLRIRYKTPVEEGVSWIRDISESGARLFLNRALRSLEIGKSLEIEIDLPDGSQPIAVQGNIVWAGENDAGLHFDKVEGDISKAIQYLE